MTGSSRAIFLGLVLNGLSQATVAKEPKEGETNPFSLGSQPAATSSLSSNSPIRPPKQVSYFASLDPAADERIREALNWQLPSEGLEFTETPLEEVINFLRDDYGMEIQIDKNALDDLGIGADEPVSVRIRNVSLKTALELMLEQIELTFVSRDGILVITTQEEAEARLQTGIYPIADLLHGEVSAAGDKLVNTIIYGIATETWAENGGGEAEIRLAAPGMLVISQTRIVHEELAAFMKGLRIAYNENPGHVLPVPKPQPEPNPKACSPQGKSAGGGWGVF